MSEKRRPLDRHGARKLKLYLRGYVPENIIDDLQGKLKDVLKMIEVEIDYHETETGERYIDLFYDIETSRDAIKRKSGPRTKQLTNYRVTPQDIRSRMASGESTTKIAQDLGISRATLWKRLRDAERRQAQDKEIGLSGDNEYL